MFRFINYLSSKSFLCSERKHAVFGCQAFYTNVIPRKDPPSYYWKTVFGVRYGSYFEQKIDRIIIRTKNDSMIWCTYNDPYWFSKWVCVRRIRLPLASFGSGQHCRNTISSSVTQWSHSLTFDKWDGYTLDQRINMRQFKNSKKQLPRKSIFGKSLRSFHTTSERTRSRQIC